MSNKHNMTNPNNMTNMHNISKYAIYHNTKKMPKLCPEICLKIQSIPHCMDSTTSSTSATSVTSTGSADAFGRLKVRVTWGAVGFDTAFTSTRRRRRRMMTKAPLRHLLIRRYQAQRWYIGRRRHRYAILLSQLVVTYVQVANIERKQRSQLLALFLGLDR